MLEIRPISLRKANEFIQNNHRHNKAVTGSKFSIACYDGEKLCGVAFAGVPVARNQDDGRTLEIRRVCTDGTYNACSMLYGACARCGKEMGYKRIITYTLTSEPGTSLKASGFIAEGETKGDTWDRPSRHREIIQVDLFGEITKYIGGKKIRWVKKFK